jgi:hypothetical protein
MYDLKPQYLRESGWGMPGREQKWKIGDAPTNNKKTLSHEGCRW